MEAETACRLALGQPLDMAGVPDPSVELHREHPRLLRLVSSEPKKATTRYTFAPPQPAYPATSVAHFRTAALTRDGAVASLKLKHVDLAAGRVVQDAREVRTKFGKTFTTYFFPVGEEARRIVEDWVEHLRTGKLWGLDDPLFPATRVAPGADRQFEAAGLERTHWSSATPIRAIFRAAFARAGLPYFNPHSFRKTLALLGERLCRTPEEFKAWSQNLGHEQVLHRTVGGEQVLHEGAVG